MEYQMRPRTGSVIQLKTGKWAARVSYIDDNGKRKVVQQTAATKGAAKARLPAMLNEHPEPGSDYSVSLKNPLGAASPAWLNPEPCDCSSSTPGYVYLIGDTDFGIYKIGRTVNHRNRINGLRKQEVKLPFRMDLIHLITTDCIVCLERLLHDMYHYCRLQGEWFRLELEEIAWLRTNRTKALTEKADISHAELQTAARLDIPPQVNQILITITAHGYMLDGPTCGVHYECKKLPLLRTIKECIGAVDARIEDCKKSPEEFTPEDRKRFGLN
jgi:hypothetical protein